MCTYSDHDVTSLFPFLPSYRSFSFSPLPPPPPPPPSLPSSLLPQSKNSLGLMWWLLCREVLRLRGTISRDLPWDVMPDLFFYRDPEEVSCPIQSLRQRSKTRTSLTDTGSPFRATFQCIIISPFTSFVFYRLSTGHLSLPRHKTNSAGRVTLLLSIRFCLITLRRS